MKHKTEIEIELDETTVYVSRRHRPEAQRSHCGLEAEIADKQAAAVAAAIAERETDGPPANGNVDRCETDTVFGRPDGPGATATKTRAVTGT